MLDILHIVMLRLECHLGNVRERLLFQTNIVEKNPYILTIGGSVGSTMPESFKSCDPGWISTFIFGAYMGPTWVFFFFLSCYSSFQPLKCMYCIHFALGTSYSCCAFLSGTVSHVESSQGALSCTFIASSTVLSHR